MNFKLVVLDLAYISGSLTRVVEIITKRIHKIHRGGHWKQTCQSQTTEEIRRHWNGLNLGQALGVATASKP